MPNAPKLPFHVSLFYSLGTITLLAGLTYVGQDIIIPVIMALLFAVLLQHLADTFNRKLRTPAVLASIAAAGFFIGSTIIASEDSLIDFILIPVYFFLFLLYKNHLIKFFTKLFRKDHHPKLRDILSMARVSVQSYISGLAIEMILVAAMTAIGFMKIGLKYDLLLEIITGPLNLITYIGAIIAGAIIEGTSLTGSADLSLIIAVIVVNILVQLADKNIISPMALSSKVEIYAFFSIIGFIIGGALGGISGIFLAIPLIAILKVIFGRIEPLERGYLLGDELPKTFVRNKVILTLYAQDAVLDTLTDKGARRPEKFK